MSIMCPCPKRKAMGYGLMALGPVGLILPILPGLVCFGLGVFVLRDQHTWAFRLFGRFAERWPGMAIKMEGMEETAWQKVRGLGARCRAMLPFGRRPPPG
ncbi:hypothetical protein ACQW02_22430 [Humitalea sp. 24SJ18S-53]|uniref:hypothetical protein n=1 Tax=Humitalea sp. 24SJ18S-53 TaxID=3422307 RepID=UPI003D664588